MGKGQISFEYLTLMGFITLIITAILGIAFFYTSSIQDGARMQHISDFAEKIVATAEYVSYSGPPSQTTIEVYLPGDVTDIDIAENTLYITYLSSGVMAKRGYSSNVNITGSLSTTEGIKRLLIVAEPGGVVITPAP